MWCANSELLKTKELQRFQNSTPNFLVEKCCLRHFRQVDSGLPYNSAPPPPRLLKTLYRKSSRRDEKIGTIKILVAGRSKTRYGKLPSNSSLTFRKPSVNWICTFDGEFVFLITPPDRFVPNCNLARNKVMWGQFRWHKGKWPYNHPLCVIPWAPFGFSYVQVAHSGATGLPYNSPWPYPIAVKLGTK